MAEVLYSKKRSSSYTISLFFKRKGLGFPQKIIINSEPESKGDKLNITDVRSLMSVSIEANFLSVISFSTQEHKRC
jgi:hypothetical protein